MVQKSHYSIHSLLQTSYNNNTVTNKPFTQKTLHEPRRGIHRK